MNCYLCGKVINEDDKHIAAKFEVPDLGESGYFYFCSAACLVPWISKTRNKMIEFATSHAND